MTQPGYDALADTYAAMFPEPYQYPIERHAAAAFAEAAAGRPGRTVDVGCGLGHVASDLAAIVRDAGAPVVCETPGGADEHRADFAFLRERL